MDVINFSGGGPQIEPANDALIEAVHNVAAAGVVPVIAAGNDRDDFGLGSVGSPGTAPDAISVAAISNTHVFAPALDVTAPGSPDSLVGIPFIGANGARAPAAWGSADQTLVDVGTIVGTDGKPVEPASVRPARRARQPERNAARRLAERRDRARRARHLPVRREGRRRRGSPARSGSSSSTTARARRTRSRSTSRSRAARSRTSTAPGCARTWPRTAAGRPCASAARPLELETGRSGVITSFSSAGPTAFGHDLKPDVSAPGGQILSSTLPNTSASRVRRLRRHVDGDAARRRRGRAPARSCTARGRRRRSSRRSSRPPAPAWADTARTQEAPVTLEGGGLVALPRAADPQLFTRARLALVRGSDVLHGAASRALLVRLTDAGDGAGTWQVQLEPQAATAGHRRRRRRRRRRPAGRRGRSRRRRARELPARWPARTTASSSCARAR